MFRTYGSKKAAVGGLDHREMLTNDETSSLFDAFYIQKIKQTKRELSCMGSSNHQGVATSKVRKKKYVKRILKEIESPVRVSESVFLTPDRSFRVNRAPDLFDQILNSSPACAQPKKDDLFDNLRLKGPTKNYNRKNVTPKKKFNYSSNDNKESDKKNLAEKNTNYTQNVSDIGAHKLIIEKAHHSCPKIDKSINQICQNISLLYKLNSGESSTGSVEKNLRCNKHRLTKNLNTPILQSSPFSSTPFTEKFRSKSIYKFSPIAMGNLDDSPSHVTPIEENNESIVYVPENSFNKSKKTESENRESPLTNLERKKEVTRTNENKLASIEGEVSPKSSKNYPTTSIIEVKHATELVETSSMQISETEPFLGFPNNKNEPEENILLDYNKQIHMYDKTDTCNDSKIPEEIKSNDLFEESSIEFTEPRQPYYQLSNLVTNDEEQESSFVFSVRRKSNNKDSAYIRVDAKKDLSQDKSDINYSSENTLPTLPFLGFTDIEAETKTNSESGDISDLCSESDHSQDSQERESLYDTCSSEQNLLHEDVVVTKEPIVSIEKMNWSLFKKYYEKMPYESCSEENSESDKSCNYYASMESSNPHLSGNSTASSMAENDITNEDNDSYFIETEKDESMSHNELSNEEECISFVTTRRRHEGTNSSAILVLDDSYANSSSGCDKTVLSYHKIETQEKFAASAQLEKEHFSETQEADDNIDEELIHNEPRISFVTTRKTTKSFRDSNVHKTQEAIDIEKPGIVLQPGKKWERSLSIFRRLTTMIDHFDHSLLEDEDLSAKGRKYRQSVISTMELQETMGSISNESINSRRSTFISKPSRSTIRIVKEPNTRLTLSNTTVFDDLKGFLEDCDDTVIELSKLSIAESDCEITILEKIHDSRVTTARDYVLRRCNQADTLLFNACYPNTLLKNCQKIGEGVYGEVYLYRGIDGRPRVMKIVPIAGSIKVNGEHQKDFDEVISEIVIAMELSALRAPIAEINRHFDEGRDVDTLTLHAVDNATDVFNEVLAVKCVYGCYPERLLYLWDLYDESKGSENDNPAILPDDQQYIVLELANAGQDLESYQFNNAEQAYALFYQVAYGLAVAEEAYQFEHRDLHWGNVLIAPTEQKYATFVLRGRAHRVARCGVAASIIDYSLSRVSLPLAAGGGDSAALYNDLAADDGLFGAVGDYQFSVYRLMREKLGNDWKSYEPYTNILWLHYIVDKMITALRYKRTNTKTHKQFIAKLKDIKERVLNYGSATLFVLT